MKKNNEVYNTVLNERIKMISGWQATDEWKECVQTNTTYLDCPIAESEGRDTYALVRNPS